MTSDLVPAARTGEMVVWSPDELDVIRQRVAPGASDAELAHFSYECAERGLSPFRGEIYGIMRWDSRANGGKGANVLTIQVSVAGRRTIAERTGLYGGQSAPLWCGPDGQWREVWLPADPPAACKVEVFRKDWDQPVTGIARYASYVQLDKQGKPKGLWSSAPDYMLHKAAEAAALKRAFPDEMAATGRELSPQSRISMEARRVGLDDDARHALVERVTGGRTDSTRDLTDDEILEVRAELATIDEPDDDTGPGAPPDLDPETGEITSEYSSLARQIKQRVETLKAADPDAYQRFKTWLDTAGIGAGKPASGYSSGDLYKVAAWLNTEDANTEPF